jgi:hypothetical protein
VTRDSSMGASSEFSSNKQKHGSLNQPWLLFRLRAHPWLLFSAVTAFWWESRSNPFFSLLPTVFKIETGNERESMKN